MLAPCFTGSTLRCDGGDVGDELPISPVAPCESFRRLFAASKIPLVGFVYMPEFAIVSDWMVVVGDRGMFSFGGIDMFGVVSDGEPVGVGLAPCLALLLANVSFCASMLAALRGELIEILLN